MASDSKARLLRDAEKYVLQGKTTHAIGEYLKILKSDPTDVLTLNTVGDLYLRQGNKGEAHRIFTQVAESYTRDNFFLKAIAVYKKILNADPKNLEINLILATLYARQGQNASARHQFLLVAELFAGAGKIRESLDAYEKVVELDPANSAIQLKLAETYSAEGNLDKAFSYYAGAARGLTKTGNLPEALVAYKRAVDLNPLDVEVLNGFLSTALSTGAVADALAQLKVSAGLKPEDVSLREMLGRAHLAAHNFEEAFELFQKVVAVDESRYDNFFDASKAYLEAGDLDRAVICLNAIIPILITRRETGRAVEGFEAILNSDPGHVPSLQGLIAIHSATNAQSLYLEKLEKLADCFLHRQEPGEALQYLEKILQVVPDSEKHLSLHRHLYASAFPGKPYPGLATRHEMSSEPGSEIASPAGDTGSNESVEEGQSTVEADLLINYGMNEKAMSLLLRLEAQDPSDKQVRTRLRTLYGDARQFEKAAEQCLLLAVLQRQEKNEDLAQRYLAEAKKLVPGILDRLDLDQLARQHGIKIESPLPDMGRQSGPMDNIEVDLSEDLSEIFFKNGEESIAPAETEIAHEPTDPITEEFVSQAVEGFAVESLETQLQEVDFYMRLGFNDEARAKLAEIAKHCPDNAELRLRYQKLAGDAPDVPVPAPLTAEEHSEPIAPLELLPEGEGGELSDFQIEEALDSFTTEGMPSPDVPGKDGELASVGTTNAENAWATEFSLPPEERAEAGGANEMFADLIREVNALTDQEISREDFETHFSLGTAYREMDLVGDAIKEFQSAVKFLNPSRYPREFIQCCGMLSTCFLEKEMPRSAIRWCQTALRVADISPHEALALRYDMGLAHSVVGEADKALEHFGHVFTLDPGYRDVARKIDDLKGGLNRHGP